MTTDEADFTEIKVSLGILKTQVNSLITQTAKQDEILRELVAMANKGKGSMWILITLGGFVGAVLTNLKTVATLFVR